MESQKIVALGHFDQDRILAPLRGVVFSQLGTQAPRLHTHHRVQMRIEVLLAPEDLGRNLVLLRGSTGMVQGMVCQIAQQFAEGLRAMESMARQKSLNLRKVLRSLGHRIPPLGNCNSNVTPST